MIDMFDPIFHGAEVDVGHSDAITEVHLDECPLNITLKNSPTSEERESVLGLVLVPGSGTMAALAPSCSWEHLSVFDRIPVTFPGRQEFTKMDALQI